MKHFLTTRARLVSLLMAAGYNAEIVPNPYEPARQMWRITPVNQGLINIVNAYYANAGKQPPAIIAQWQHAIDKGERL